jgi:hypothetical protein
LTPYSGLLFQGHLAVHGLFNALSNLRRENERRLPELLSPAPFHNAGIKSLQVRGALFALKHRGCTYQPRWELCLVQGSVWAGQTTVSRPVQRPVAATRGRAAAANGMETVHLVTVRGPIFPQTAAGLLRTAQRGHGPSVAITQLARTDPQHTFYVG